MSSNCWRAAVEHKFYPLLEILFPSPPFPSQSLNPMSTCSYIVLASHHVNGHLPSKHFISLLMPVPQECHNVKAPVKSSPPTKQHSFLQAGCHSWHSTNSVKALKGKISHSMDLLTPNSPGIFQLLFLTTNSSWLPWRGLSCLLSALWCQYSKNVILYAL